MTTTKYHGKYTVLLYAATINTAPTIDMSGTSRSVEVQEQGQDIDVSTRDDLLLDSTAYLVGPPQRSVQLQGLDTTPAASRTWHNVSIGDVGRVAVYPYGSSPSGQPYEIGNVTCTNRTYTSPHDNAATYNVQWRVTGPWTAGTT